jgi:cell division protein FtsB
MHAMILLLLALLFHPFLSSSIHADACSDLRSGAPGSGASVFIPCIAQHAKELSELMMRNAQQEKEIAKLNAEIALQKKIASDFINSVSRGDINKRIDDIGNALFGDVDSVYTIAAKYDLDSIDFRPILVYIYAIPERHCISAIVRPIGVIPTGNEQLPFSIDFLVNNRKVYINSTNVNDDISDRFQVALQGTGGVGRDDKEGTDQAATYPPYIQLIEIRPHIPINSDAARKGTSVNIQGYILVRRKQLSGGCRESK